MRWTTFFIRARRLVLLAGLSLALAGCGGGSDDDTDAGSAQLRVINATVDAGPIDFTVDGEASDETRVITALAPDAQSEFAALAAGGYTLRGKRTATETALAVNTVSVEKDKRYTAFVYGRSGDYRINAAVEDQAEPAAGKAMLRVFHGAPDAGAVDVYLTESDASIDDAVPLARNLAPATLSFYNLADRGAWRLRITGQGNPRDVRLDVAALELADKARVTVVLQPSTGGVLVHALVSQHHGALAATKNTQARVRLAAGVAGNGAVSASVGGVSVSVNLRSPSVGAYALVPAGVVPVSVSVNGQPPIMRNVSIGFGQDVTLAAVSDLNGLYWRRVHDDNRQQTQAKLRLLHMALAIDARLTLSMDFVAVGDDVFLANPHLYAPVAATTRTRLEVTSPLSAQPLYLNDSAELAAGGVYTMFVMEGQAQPTGLLRRDR